MIYAPAVTAACLPVPWRGHTTSHTSASVLCREMGKGGSFQTLRGRLAPVQVRSFPGLVRVAQVVRDGPLCVQTAFRLTHSKPNSNHGEPEGPLPAGCPCKATAVNVQSPETFRGVSHSFWVTLRALFWLRSWNRRGGLSGWVCRQPLAPRVFRVAVSAPRALAARSVWLPSVTSVRAKRPSFWV